MEEDRIVKKLRRREMLYDIQQRMKRKHSEEYEVLEEVFDKPTLMTIYDLMNAGVIDVIFGVVKAGKESRIYWAKSPEGRDLAIKIYLTVSSEFKRGMLPYIEGDPRFTHIKRDTRSLVYAWAQKEFKNLKRAYEAGVRVPEPFAVSKNVLVMEFIGDEGVPAPLLKYVELENPEATLNTLLEYVRRLYQVAELIHGDLSEYNVMMWDDTPVLIDISQGVPLEHPMADLLLRRDLKNLLNYFSRLGVEAPSLEEAYRWVVGGGP